MPAPSNLDLRGKARILKALKPRYNLLSGRNATTSSVCLRHIPVVLRLIRPLQKRADFNNFIAVP